MYLSSLGVGRNPRELLFICFNQKVGAPQVIFTRPGVFGMFLKNSFLVTVSFKRCKEKVQNK